MRLFTRGGARRQIFEQSAQNRGFRLCTSRCRKQPSLNGHRPGHPWPVANRRKQLRCLPRLALPLLVTRLGAADYPQNAFATYNFAVTADLFDRSAYFHDLTSIHSCCSSGRSTAAVALQIRLFHQPLVLVRQQVRLNLCHEVHHHDHNDQQ